MNDLNHNTDGGVQVDIDRMELAAKALAAADSKNWSNVDVRARYHGLALATVGAYLAPPATGEE